MSHNTLENYYKTVFNMQYHHRFQNVEEMIPFEKDIYSALLTDFFAQEDEKRTQERLQREAIASRGY